MTLRHASVGLAVPGFYHSVLDDIDIHTAKTAITTAGITADLPRGVLGGYSSHN